MNKSTTEEVPPTYLIFSTALGVLVNNNSQIASAITSTTPVTAPSIAPINALTLPATTSATTPLLFKCHHFLILILS